VDEECKAGTVGDMYLALSCGELRSFLFGMILPGVCHCWPEKEIISVAHIEPIYVSIFKAVHKPPFVQPPYGYDWPLRILQGCPPAIHTRRVFYAQKTAPGVCS
jgi:hypothetical protein